MWKNKEIDSTPSGFRFRIEDDSHVLSQEDFLNLLASSAEFRSYYCSILAECDYDAFLWENNPMSTDNLDEPYECSLIDCPYLAIQSPDPNTFSEHFRDDCLVVDFPNLVGDAHLLAPCPNKPYSDYTHIGCFVRSGRDEQIHRFFSSLARQVRSNLLEDPIWLSTSGLGVFWLHARLDSRPKYYQTEAYKMVAG